MKSTAMTKVVSALTAQTQFGQILRRIKKNNERFVVDRRGEPEAVIMSVADYVETMAPTPGWLKAVGEASKRRGTAKLSMRQIDAVIAATRREAQHKRG